ncbi:MAG: hypothetical protein V1735_06760 [Nanoarchaeota archaeon]
MVTKSLSINRLIKGKKTYPTWSTESCHRLAVENYNQGVIVFYFTKGKRKISRRFPKNIALSPKFCYALGFLKGEGSNSLGKSNYRRFTITNSDPVILSFVLNELGKNQLFQPDDLIDKSVHLIHFTKSPSEVIAYWSNMLSIPKKKFVCFYDKKRTSPFGVCHIYISDVLLRRVVDLFHEKMIK